MKVWVGEEPVAILLDAHANVLLGIVANKWTSGVNKLLDRLLTADAAVMYRRSGSMESMLDVGYVYLSFKATGASSLDAPICMVLRPLLKGALLKKVIAPLALIEGGAR
tara:strand:- start:696 stop:1022 length:327 start_codon:yes stop_codon:yes gene_type:complete